MSTYFVHACSAKRRSFSTLRRKPTEGLASLGVGHPRRSEVDDHIGGADNRVVTGRSNSRIGVAVERRRVQRLVVSDFRTELDLRRKPVLPASRDVYVAGGDAGTLAVMVVEPLGAEREVVQLVWRIVDVEQEGLLVGPASQHRGIRTKRGARRIERNKLRAEGRAAAGDNGRSRRIVEIRHIVLVDIPAFEGDVPVVVELVIVSAADPLQVVVAPLAAVQCVANDVKVVPAIIAGPADTKRRRRNGAGILGKGGAGIERIARHEIGQILT